ncbi:osteopetrosis-associated transmembrane protein 1 isoform X3 [Osmerus eperlanus]|uniref:osteopetrosis-associated transmembrane protein 1 isoform X3 n=1 Tax=Osmerus eperlanus TaxID=29151 RepID=UPI002E15A99D
MSLFNASALFIMLIMYSIITASTEGVNTIIPNSDPSQDGAVLGPVVSELAVSQSSFGPHVSLNFLSAFTEDLEGSDYCVELLRIFGQRYVSNVNCLVSYARPVQVCENCLVHYNSLTEIYTNISSDQMGPGNVSCRDSLLRSDRLMLIYLLYDNLEEIWTTSGCDHCVNEGLNQLTNDTFYFMAVLNQTRSCFERYQQQGNHSELCMECKATYKGLNELYGRMEKNSTLCIDIEDAVRYSAQGRLSWRLSFKRSEN